MTYITDDRARLESRDLPENGHPGQAEPSTACIPPSNLLRCAAIGCAAGSLAIAAAGLLGWMTGTRLLNDLQARHIPMAPMTACLLLLLSGTLILRQWRPLDPRTCRLGFFTAGITITLSTLVLALPSFGLTLPLEQWLAPSATMLDSIPTGRMAPLTAYALFTSATVLLFTLRPFANHWLCRQIIIVLAPTSLLASLVITMSHAVNTPLLYGSGTIPMALTSAIALALLNLNLLIITYAETLSFSVREDAPNGRFSLRRLMRSPLTITTCVLIAIAVVAFSYHTRQVDALRSKQSQTIAAIADLKTQRILRWRARQMANARLAMIDPFVRPAVSDLLQGLATDDTRSRLASWLDAFRKLTEGKRALLLDPHLKVGLTSPESLLPSDPLCREDAIEALRTRHAVISDFHLDPAGEIHLDLAIPLLPSPTTPETNGIQATTPSTEPIGLVVIEVDPHASLYPVIQDWPTPSPTAETVMVRREGDEIVYLNELRHRPGTTLRLRTRIPDNQRLPAALAAMGHEGCVEGVDYRNVPVLAAMRRIPGTPWHIVAKVDLAEFLAPIRERAWTAGAILFVLTLAATIGAGLQQRQRDRWWLERQRAIERDSQERHRALFVTSQHALMTLAPPDWRFISANPATVRVFEAKDEAEFVAASPWVVSPERQPDGRLSAEKATEMIETAIREGSHYFEWTHRRLGGQDFPATVLLTRMELGGSTVLQATVHDITEQKQAEAALREKEHFQTVLLENLSAGVMILDARTHVIESVNPAGAALIGARPEEILGRTCHQLICPRQEGTCPVTDLGEEVNTSDSTLLRADGIQLPVLKSVKRLNFGGKEKLIEMFIDIGERKQMEQELRNANSYLEDITARAHDMAAKAEAANIAKSEFLANMSHEIRTPMTAILGYAELVSESADCCTQCPDHVACQTRNENRQHLATIRRNGEHLLNVINDILDLSRVEAGRMTVEQITCSLRAIVEDVASTMRVRAAAKQLAYNTEYIGPIPETIRSDPGRLRQILINLVANAVKFTETGGVRVIVRCVTDTPKPFVQFDVVDTGIGMSEEQTAQLFQAFVQADTSMSRRFGGSGLGLAIAKNLAKMLGGDVSIVETQPNLGTRFRITVATGPLDGVRMTEEGISESTGASPGRHGPAGPPSRRTMEGVVVLLVEDSPDNQRLISHVLRSSGARVVTTDNGQAGLRAALNARDSGHPFDIILMDMQMPVLDGYHAARQLREEDYQGVIIALTAHAMSDDRDRCLAAGCDAYATKPIDRSALIGLISEFLTSARQRPPHASPPAVLQEETA